MRFAENLKILRKNKGLTQKELANELGVALSTVAMWETSCRKPDLVKLQQVADYFGVSVDTFFMEGEELSGEFLSEEEMPARISRKNRDRNDDLFALREMLRSRPEMKMLFSVSKNASKEDIERTVAIIEALKNRH